jgi:hypothetical protein
MVRRTKLFLMWTAIVVGLALLICVALMVLAHGIFLHAQTLEGRYVAKDERGQYEGGRTRGWLKMKQRNWTVEEDGWRRRIFGRTDDDAARSESPVACRTAHRVGRRGVGPERVGALAADWQFFPSARRLQH